MNGYPKLKEQRENGLPLLTGEIDKTLPDDLPSSDERREKLAKRQATAAISLLRLGQADPVWPLFQHSSDPRVRSYLIHWLSSRGVDPRTILSQLSRNPEVSIQRALLLCLGAFDESTFPSGLREKLIPEMLTMYRHEPDAGLHAATEWLLRRWGMGKQIIGIDQELQQTEGQRRAKHDEQRNWYINTQGQTFVILEAGEFLMGSPESEPQRQTSESLHKRRIGRRIALSAKLVTKAQWRAFSKANRTEWSADNQSVASYICTEDSPMTGMTWFEAAWYCNWLSQQEGIPKDQWCYTPNWKGKYNVGMKAKKNFWDLTGYRLPTEAEWEFACRAETVTSTAAPLIENVTNDS